MHNQRRFSSIKKWDLFYLLPKLWVVFHFHFSFFLKKKIMEKSPHELKFDSFKFGERGNKQVKFIMIQKVYYGTENGLIIITYVLYFSSLFLCIFFLENKFQNPMKRLRSHFLHSWFFYWTRFYEIQSFWRHNFTTKTHDDKKAVFSKLMATIVAWLKVNGMMIRNFSLTHSFASFALPPYIKTSY